ncbi:MAG TPA: homocysteine S-methyltransferase family protein [Sphingomicrobium sp.]|nr:homocysteine S-methyltransferase family protein [Sphingomicrobium sp.]
MHHNLPQLDRLFLTDGGIETDFIFNRGFALPSMSAVMLLRTADGRAALEDYYRSYLDLARRAGTGFELVSASWRASPAWAPELGISQEELDSLNRSSVDMLLEMRDRYESDALPIVVTGCIGPRGDGYDPGEIMTVEQAEAYHLRQASVLASAGADMLSAITMTNVNEAIGIVRAARSLAIPVSISFTVETDGSLPTGEPLAAAIAAVDEATDSYAAYFMVNCAHPTHFAAPLMEGGAWTKRIGGLRANASRCSHAELDGMDELDTGDPVELGQLYRQLRERLPHINVLGGCCGTDIRHVTAIAESCAAHRTDRVAEPSAA